MRCFNKEESRAWCESHGIMIAGSGEPSIASLPARTEQSIVGLKLCRVVALARLTASIIQPFEECLLWITLWGVWPSSENMLLFDRLRVSYGERRALHECPGHLFLPDEQADLVAFIQIALTSGWNFFLLPSPFRCGVFVSHDEYIDAYADQAVSLEPLRDFFEPAD
jgi:hypothetical protein